MGGEVLSQVFKDESRFRNDHGLGLAGTFHADDGRFTQRVDLLQLRRRHHLLPLEDFDAVVDIGAFFQKPDHTLGAGVVEPD